MSRKKVSKSEIEINTPEQKGVVGSKDLSATKKVVRKKPIRSVVKKLDQKEPVKKIKWSKKKIMKVVGVIMVVLLIGVLLIAVNIKMRTKFLDSPRDNQLRDENNNVSGSVIEEKTDNFKRVIYRFKKSPPEDGYSYHGWFGVNEKSEMKYAGEFYSAGKGEYQLIFTSQDKDKEYPLVFVSLEKGQPGEKPAKIVAVGGIKGE